MKKFISGFVALAFAVTVAAPAGAQSTSDLEAQIQALLAQIAALSGTTTTTVAAPSSCNFTQTLTLGSTGAEVVELQSFLEMKGTLTIPAGVAKGYFGGLTQSALASYQAMVGISPAVGFFGPVTRAHVNGMCSTPVVVVPPTTETPSSSQFDTNDGEEADFSDVDVEDADDDTLEEGDNKAEIAEVEFELEEGGAALLERFDVILDYTGGEAADEDDAWEVFNTIYLMVDGDIIAEMDADDEDDWEDNSTVGDETRFRISGINHVFDAEEEHVIVIAADIAGSLDLGADNRADWTFTLVDTGMRFVDEAGITVYLDEESSASTDTATFSIEEEGQDDELDVQSSNDDPESTTLKVEDDEASDDYTVFIFELEADEDSSDLDIDKLPVMVEVTGGNYNDIVKDEMIEIDGEEFDDVDITYYSANTFLDAQVVAGPTAFALLTFDVDEDFTVEADETVNVELVLEFKSADGVNYNPGATVMAKVSSDDAATTMDLTDVTAEGADDVIADGSATGDVHTLLVEGINAETTSTSKTVVVVDGATNDYADFEIELDVEAFEADAFISENAATSIMYSIVDANTGVVFGGGTRVASLSSSADLEGAYYRVNENDVEEFTFSVSFTPGAAGSYRMRIDSIEFDDTAVAPTQSYVTIPAQDYRTGNANITG